MLKQLHFAWEPWLLDNDQTNNKYYRTCTNFVKVISLQCLFSGKREINVVTWMGKSCKWLFRFHLKSCHDYQIAITTKKVKINLKNHLKRKLIWMLKAFQYFPYGQNNSLFYQECYSGEWMTIRLNNLCYNSERTDRRIVFLVTKVVAIYL